MPSLNTIGIFSVLICNVSNSHVHVSLSSCTVQTGQTSSCEPPIPTEVEGKYKKRNNSLQFLIVCFVSITFELIQQQLCSISLMFMNMKDITPLSRSWSLQRYVNHNPCCSHALQVAHPQTCLYVEDSKIFIFYFINQTSKIKSEKNLEQEK